MIAKDPDAQATVPLVANGKGGPLYPDYLRSSIRSLHFAFVYLTKGQHTMIHLKLLSLSAPLSTMIQATGQTPPCPTSWLKGLRPLSCRLTVALSSEVFRL